MTTRRATLLLALLFTRAAHRRKLRAIAKLGTDSAYDDAVRVEFALRDLSPTGEKP